MLLQQQPVASDLRVISAALKMISDMERIGDQAADIALGTAAQTAAAQTAISVGYIWVETIAYVICAILIFFFTIEKDLPEEQKAIAARKNNK